MNISLLLFILFLLSSLIIPLFLSSSITHFYFPVIIPLRYCFTQSSLILSITHEFQEICSQMLMKEERDEVQF